MVLVYVEICYKGVLVAGKTHVCLQKGSDLSVALPLFEPSLFWNGNSIITSMHQSEKNRSVKNIPAKKIHSLPDSRKSETASAAA